MFIYYDYKVIIGTYANACVLCVENLLDIDEEVQCSTFNTNSVPNRVVS